MEGRALGSANLAARPAPARKADDGGSIQRILEAATEEFGERGFDGVTVDEIARRAGVTKQLIYYYYGPKDELYEAVLNRASFNAICPLFREPLDALPPVESARRLFGSIFDQYRDNPGLATMTLDQNLRGCEHISPKSVLRVAAPFLVRRFAAIVERGVASGEFRADVDPQRAFASALAVMTGCFITGQTMSTFLAVDILKPEGVEAWREHALDFIIHALRPRQVA